MKILAIIAHPNVRAGKVNSAFLDTLLSIPEVTVHQLYEAYPDWKIDVKKEQELLLSHDRILLQFPIYWFSMPPMLKKWYDDVLQYGWAYAGNYALENKEIMVVCSTGGTEASYKEKGVENFENQILLPSMATHQYCKMKIIPSFVQYDAHNFEANKEVACASLRDSITKIYS